MSTPAIKCARTESHSDFTMNRDRFEDLPDGILMDILSFVPTEIAVRASVLSKRWKRLWMDVRNLELREQNTDKLSVTRFQNFVDKVLQHRTSAKVNKFSLFCHAKVDPRRISRWIDYAVTHSVQELSISVRLDHVPYRSHGDRILPSSLFTCDSVVKFNLHASGAYRALDLPSLIRFTNLRVLTLGWVTFSDEYLSSQLFSNCPVLEELNLNVCRWQCQSVHVPCLRLSSLVIKDCTSIGVVHECQILIHGTSLKFFKYMGECEIECCLVNSNFLVEAYIDVRPTRKKDRPLEEADRVLKLFQALYNVQSLAISSDTLQILNYKEDSFSQMPLFRNLTRLRLDRGPVVIQLHSRFLNFLKLCPSIDHLESIEGMILGGD